MKHTDTPWTFDGHGINADGERIAKMSQAPYIYDTGLPVRNEIFDANANFIVRACNSHAELLEALEHALPLLQREDLWDNTGDWFIAQRKAIAAIAKAS